MTWAIELDGLTKSFRGKMAVENLSLNVEAGSILGFLGQNGAGKTTTIKMMLGLLRPDSGGGRILGKSITGESLQVLRKVGYVAEVQQMYGYMSVNEILNFSRQFYSRWNSALIKRYLDFFSLPSKEKIKNLSKGMKTQLALILAMAHEPEVLVLDEPSSGLDPINRQEFLRIILDEISLQGKTVFLSSHQLHDVERVADKVAFINQGRLLDVRSMDNLKTTVKKIRVVFQREPGSSLFSQPGITEVSREGSAYLIAVEENLEGILAEIKKYPYFTLDIIDQNLEEIFIEKVRGDRHE